MGTAISGKADKLLTIGNNNPKATQKPCKSMHFNWYIYTSTYKKIQKTINFFLTIFIHRIKTPFTNGKL